MRVWLYVAVGAALGGVARFGLAGFIQQRAGPSFPTGTLLVNLSGALLLGFLVRLASQSSSITPEMRLFLTTGFCGGYTTFSTFSYETTTLLQDGEYLTATSYVLISVLGSLAATLLGFAVASWVLALRERV